MNSRFQTARSAWLASAVMLSALPAAAQPAWPDSARQSGRPACRNAIALSFGVNQVKEKILHPKVGTGTLTTLAYTLYARRMPLRQFSIAFGYSRMKTSLEDLSKTLNVSVDAQYGHPFAAARRGRMAYHAGPAARLAYNASFYPNWDDSHLYWADFISVGAAQALRFETKRGDEWSASLTLPLAAVCSRPPPERLFKIDDTDAGDIAASLHDDPAFGTWNRVFYLDFRLAYNYPAFRAGRQALHYSAEFARIASGGAPFTRMSHLIGISFYL
jgi:hypothetical protein